MRHLLVVLGMALLCVLPILGWGQTHIYRPQYKISAGPEVWGPRMDTTQRVIFVCTRGQGATALVRARARETARVAALTAARKELVAFVTGLSLTSYATVQDAFTAKILPADLLRAMATTVFPVVEHWNAESRTLLMVAALPLSGANSPQEIAARMLKLEQESATALGGTPIRKKEDMCLRTVTPPNQLSDGPYSGVILDCTGLGYTPPLLPKLVADDGKECWGTVGVNSLLVMDKGAVRTCADLREALESGRVGAMPLIIRPVGVAGLRKGDLVLSADDAAKLTAAEADSHFLATLSIVILAE